MLRRKRGADYDLDDSDDGGEARKRMKRRQFAKMQKALFADERVKKMAENPGNQAFLRTLEDHVSDDEMDIINVDEPDETEESQSQSDVPQGVVPDSQPTPKTQQPKSGAGKHPPAHMRRTKDGKKPSNLGEIRESLSSLLEDPDMAIVPATQYGSESEAEEDPIPSTSRSDKENRSPPPPRNNRRTNEVCDRISLKRANSSSSSVNARHAFTIGSTQSGGFNAPALLRRATSNSFMSSVSASSSGTSTPTDNPKHNSFGDKIKKGATKGSGIIRERDRTGAKQLAGMREKRDQRRMKGAEERLRAVSGLFGGAKFE
jgi:mediator of replication checkpoint protein 1